MTPGSKKQLVVLTTLTALSLVIYIIFVIFNLLNVFPNTGVFKNEVGTVSNKFATNIVPANYAFMIWNLIFLWNIAWLIYVLTMACRTNKDGPVIVNPIILPYDFYLYWNLATIGTLIWLFVWDEELVSWSAAVLVISTAFGHAALFRHSIMTASKEDEISKSELIAIRVLIQNGMGIYFSWITVASVLNISFALSYGPSNVDIETSSIICVCILGVVVVTWAMLENTVLFSAFHSFYIWYAVLIWATIGVMVKNFDPSNVSSILVAVLLCTTVVCLIAKIIVHIFRRPRVP